MTQPRGMIQPEDYQRIREVFEAALTCPAADRAAFVERACSGKERLILEVQCMLAADAETHPLLDASLLSGQGLQEGTALPITLKLPARWVAVVWARSTLRATRS